MGVEALSVIPALAAALDAANAREDEARSAAERSGGQVGPEREVGLGTTAWVTLPEPEALDHGADEPQAPATARNR